VKRSTLIEVMARRGVGPGDPVTFADLLQLVALDGELDPSMEAGERSLDGPDSQAPQQRRRRNDM
jgi:hypothetical protein